MVQVADVMADVLKATKPYSIDVHGGEAIRAKVDFGVLEDAKLRVRALAENAGIDYESAHHGYPHFYYIDDKPVSHKEWTALDLQGKNVRPFVNYVFSSRAESLKAGQSQVTQLITPKGKLEGVLTNVDGESYRFSLPTEKSVLAASWLRDLSDGYVKFDPQAVRRVPGPIIITESSAEPVTKAEGEARCR